MFRRSVRPDQFRLDLERLSDPEWQAMLQGARDAAVETMDATYRGGARELDLFQSPANQQKLRVLLQRAYGTDQGNAATDNLITAVNRERNFANSRTTTIMNCETARRVSAALGGPAGPDRGPGTQVRAPCCPRPGARTAGPLERQAAGIADRQATMRESLART